MKTFTKVTSNKLKSRISRAQPSRTQVIPDKRHKRPKYPKQVLAYNLPEKIL